jgi:hypothetical protein
MFVGGGSVWHAKAGWPTAALDPTTVQVAPPAHIKQRGFRGRGAAAWFGADSRETGSQRRIPVPAGSAGDIGGSTSRQRHFSRRRHREPPHAEFRWETDEFHVVDVGSLNSTYVNREPVDSAVLVNGDEVQIGKFRLTFLTKPKNHGGAGGTHDSDSADR